jgi:hypothetical protein
MSTIVQKATAYIVAYVREHYQPPEDHDELLDVYNDIDMYNDRWLDDFGSSQHDFPIVTSIELMQAINYCNEHSEFHDFNQDFTTVEEITSLFLRTLLVELNILSK